MAKHPGGRPPKFNSPQEVLDKAQIYFNDCIDKKVPITITGLAMALDTTRRTLIDYEGKGDEFSHAIKKCKTVCENYAERKLFEPKAATGAIFALKNYGWSDRQEVEHSGKVLILDE